MSHRKRTYCLAIVGAFLSLTTSAFAQTVQFTITSGNAPSGTYGIMGGVYTSPYTGYVGSNSSATIPAICDDFTDEVNPPESWQALATNLSALSSSAATGSNTYDVYWDQGGGGSSVGGYTTQQFNYMVAALLAEEILGVDQTTAAGQTEAGELSFALWGVFDSELLPENLAGLSTSSPDQLDGAKTDLANAQQEVTTNIGDTSNYLSTFSNVTIYSEVNPATGNTALVGKDGQGTGGPQEFIVVNMPEPSSAAILGLDLLGVGGLLLFARRRWARSTRSS